MVWFGLCLLLGGLKHRNQTYNLQGANAFLSVLVPLAIFALVLPRITHSAPGGELSPLQVGFEIVMSVILYGVFLAIQTVTHSDIFRQPDSADDHDEHHGVVVRTVPFHVIGFSARFCRSYSCQRAWRFTLISELPLSARRLLSAVSLSLHLS
jgi:Ca2+:H+ antiporter